MDPNGAIEIVYPNNNNNNIIIIIIIIKGKKSIKRKGEGALDGERELREGFYFFISLFISFSDLRKSNRRFSLGLKAKLIYVMRATRGHQKVGVSTNSVR